MKVLVSLVWYMLYGLSLQIVLSILAASGDEVHTKLSIYLECESTGVNPGKVCDRSAFENADSTRLLAIQHVVGVWYPVVNTMYAFNLKEIKRRWNHCCHEISQM